jgi:hypothetical protein
MPRPIRSRRRCGRAASGQRQHAQVGELIYVRMQARRGAPWQGRSSEPVHTALLMIVPRDRQTGPHVRLVQDFGNSDEPPGFGEG